MTWDEWVAAIGLDENSKVMVALKKAYDTYISNNSTFDQPAALPTIIIHTTQEGSYTNTLQGASKAIYDVYVAETLMGIPVGVNTFATYDAKSVLAHELTHVLLSLQVARVNGINVNYGDHTEYQVISTGYENEFSGYTRTGYRADGNWESNYVQFDRNDPLTFKYLQTHPDLVTQNVKVYGGSGNDTFGGGKGADTLNGGAGNDTIDGGAGADTIKGGADDDILRGGDTTDQDFLWGQTGNDIIYTVGHDAGWGEAGNDIIFSSGNGILETSLGGGADYDYYLIEGGKADINDDNTYTAQGTILVLVNGEYIKLTGGTKVYDANGNWTNTWKGPFGEIYTLDANSANIEVHIGNSTITIHKLYEGYNSLDIYLSPTGPQAGLVSVTGTMIVPGDNTNGAGSNGAVNFLTGGSGNDTFFVDNAGDTITEQKEGGNDTVLSSVTYTLSNNVEMLVLMGETAINATGNTLDNFLLGNSADNILNGSSGADTMIGNGGNDTYYVDNIGDRIIETSTKGMDTVISTVTYSLGNNLENLTLSGLAVIDGTGNSLDNILIGNSADNTLDGGAGTDIAVFSGNSTNYTFVKNANGSISVTDKTTNRDGVDTLINIEQLKFLDTTFQASNLTFTVSNDQTITGTSGNDALSGDHAGSYDTIYGREGNDVLIGGFGNDTYVFNVGDGTDLIMDYNAVHTVERHGWIHYHSIKYLNAGTDTLSFGSGITLDTIDVEKDGSNLLLGIRQNGDTASINQLTDLITVQNFFNSQGTIETMHLNDGSNFDITSWIIGTSGDDILSGTGRLYGGRGDDTITSGIGNDSLSGGAGADTFVFNTALNATTNKDTITDFTAVDDTIKLENDIFTALTAIGTLSASNFVANATGTAGDANDYILYNTTTGALYYDADGIGAIAAVQFALLGTSLHPTITNADFLVS